MLCFVQRKWNKTHNNQFLFIFIALYDIEINIISK